MKFAEHLAAHITPEWRKQYIQYEAMKDQLYLCVEQAPSAEVTDEETIQRYFARFDEDFLQFCDKELLKINTFFSEKLAEANRKIENLKSELSASEQSHIEGALATKDRLNNRRSSIGHLGKKIRNRKKAAAEEQQTTIRKMHDIKLAFSEFYLSLILLQNYQTLNFTGFRKILKKHDKLMSTDTGAQFRQAHVETATFYTSKHVDHLIKDTESVFTQRLEGGDRQKAMKRLRVPPLGEVHNPWTTFRVGLFAGIFMVLVSAAILASFTTSQMADYKPALRMYRAVFLVILCCFLLGINTYGWSSSGVNHVLIFELDPRDHLTHQQLLEISGFFAVIWSLSVLAFLYSSYLHIPQYVHPLCLVGFFIIYLINPIRILHYKARYWLLSVLFRIFTAPFHHVGFADFWLADQLNSLSSVILDFEFFICYYASEVEWHAGAENRDVCGGVTYGIVPIVACLPAWFRFAQCLRRYRDTRLVFPHIVNAGKYSTTFFVVLFKSLHQGYDKEDSGTMFFYLWMAAAFISTCYTFTWDIKMDWGLFDKNAGENRFLREEVVYAYKGYYYFAIVQDFILRFAWTIQIALSKNNLIEDSEVIKSIFTPFEVFRRFIWNFFRLENEHLNNCGQFRAVRDISILPIDANDQQLLETMMDEEDGVTNRKKGGDRQKLLATGRLKSSTKHATKAFSEEFDEEV